MAGAARYPWLAILVSNVQTLLLAVSWFAARRQGRAFDARAGPAHAGQAGGPARLDPPHRWPGLQPHDPLDDAGQPVEPDRRGPGDLGNVLIPLGRDGKTSRRIVLSTVGAAGLVVQAVAGVRSSQTSATRRPERFRADDFDADNGVVALAQAARAALHADGAGDCLVRIVHDDAWTIAAELVVRLTKAGCRVSVDAEWELSFGPQHARRGPPQGTLLVCKAAADAGPLRRRGNWWGERPPPRSSGVRPRRWPRAEGRYEARDMELFAEELDGFFPAERSGGASFRWSGGSESRLVLRLCKGQAYRLQLKVAPYPVADRVQQTPDGGANDNTLATFALPNEAAEEHVVILPAALAWRIATRWSFATAMPFRPIP